MRLRRPSRGPLPSRATAGVLIGGMLADLEQAVANRPRPVAQIEQPVGRERFERHGFVLDGLEAEVDRPEPPDRSGATL